jgi:hypothetical protein
MARDRGPLEGSILGGTAREHREAPAMHRHRDAGEGKASRILLQERRAGRGVLT